MKNLVRSTLRRAGFEVRRVGGDEALMRQHPDVTDNEWRVWKAVEPFTMTTLERVIAVVRATQHIVRCRIPGDIVECGVWRGGSSMAIAHTLCQLGDISRRIVLYDTFEGMTEPQSADVSHAGMNAAELLEAAKTRQARDSWIWAYASLEDVRANMASVPYPGGNIQYVKGPVEQTIPASISDRIALLRLDTDWYESTRHELVHLYPRLSPSGILIVDDYGHWRGARKAVDEYFGSEPPFLHRIDYTGRLVVKP